MDKVIKSLVEILEIKHKKIADLLVFSRHFLDESNSFGSRLNSTLSTFEIISPPLKTAMLDDLKDVEKEIIHSAVLLLFPVKDNAPEIREIIFKADPNLSQVDEFIQFIDDNELINDISIGLHLLERKPPKFWTDYKSKISESLLENDYRSEFFRMLGMKYHVSSEEESKTGRTDLILKSTSLSRKIFEFKVWNRNDYLLSANQLLKYLTEIDDSGFVIMANSRRNSNITLEEYEQVIKSSSYIENSMVINKTNHGIEYYEACYLFNDSEKKIFHFILNLK